MFRRIGRVPQVETARKEKEETKRQEIAELAASLSQQYRDIRNIREDCEEARDRLSLLQAAGAPQTEIDVARANFNAAEKDMQVAEGLIKCTERRASRRYPSHFAWI